MRSLILSLVFVFVFALVSCRSNSSMTTVASQRSGSSVAVVSVAANNFGDSLQGWNSANTSDLMGSRVAKMLAAAERELGSRFAVVPASGFVGKPAVQQQKGARFEVGLARLPQGTLPVFAQDRSALIKASLTADQARALTRATGADLVAVIYSEWTVATGSFVPTAKALTKNVMSLYDANGQQVYNARQDAMGTQTLGAFGRVAVDESTIDQWVESYETALTTLVGS